jgi:hypothetical protein
MRPQGARCPPSRPHTPCGAERRGFTASGAPTGGPPAAPRYLGSEADSDDEARGSWCGVSAAAAGAAAAGAAAGARRPGSPAGAPAAGGLEESLSPLRAAMAGRRAAAGPGARHEQQAAAVAHLQQQMRDSWGAGAAPGGATAPASPAPPSRFPAAAAALAAAPAAGAGSPGGSALLGYGAQEDCGGAGAAPLANSRAAAAPAAPGPRFAPHAGFAEWAGG